MSDPPSTASLSCAAIFCSRALGSGARTFGDRYVIGSDGRRDDREPAGLRLVGFVDRASVVNERAELRVQEALADSDASSPPSRIGPSVACACAPSSKIGRASGETLSQSMAPDVIESFIPAWVRERGSAGAGDSLAALALAARGASTPTAGSCSRARPGRPSIPTGCRSCATTRSTTPSNLPSMSLARACARCDVAGTARVERRSLIVGNGLHRVRLLFENDPVTTARDRSAIKVQPPASRRADPIPYNGIFTSRAS